VTEQDTFTIAVKADSLLTGKGIYAFHFGLSFDATYLEFLNIDSVGSILNDWGIPTFNKNKSGQIIIAGAGSSPLSGQGNLLYLKFNALRANYWFQLGNISGQNYLKEFSPASTLKHSYIHIKARSYPAFYNENYQLFVEEEAKMNVSGGTSQYIFNSVDTA